MYKMTCNLVQILPALPPPPHSYSTSYLISMKLVIPLNFIELKEDSKQCCDTTTPGSIRTKDECNGMTSFEEFMI